MTFHIPPLKKTKKQGEMALPAPGTTIDNLSLGELEYQILYIESGLPLCCA